MFLILFTIEIIGALAILISYGIVSLIGVVHIAFSKARIILFPPPTIFTMSVIHFMLNFLMVMLCIIAKVVPTLLVWS